MAKSINDANNLKALQIQIEEGLNRFFDEMERCMEYVYPIKFEKKERRQAQKRLVRLITKLLSHREAFETKPTGDPIRDTRERLEAFSNVIVEELPYKQKIRAKKHRTLFHFILYEGKKHVKRRINCYPQIWDTAEGLCKDIIAQEKYREALHSIDLYYQFPQSLVLAQRLFNPLLEEHMKYLSEHPNLRTRKQVERAIEIFSDLISVYEKTIRLALIWIKLKLGEPIDMDSIRKQTLANIIRYLRKRGYDHLVPCESYVRNSLAGHDDYFIDPRKKMIVLCNRGHKVGELSYDALQEVVIKTAELVTVLLYLPLMLNLFCMEGFLSMLYKESSH